MKIVILYLFGVKQKESRAYLFAFVLFFLFFLFEEKEHELYGM